MAFSKITHVTIVGENYGQLSKFYEAVVGMRASRRSFALPPEIVTAAREAMGTPGN